MSATELRRYAQKQRGRGKRSMHLHIELFSAWCEAAADYKDCPSGPNRARCTVARGAWYLAVYGVVPPVAAAGGEEW